MAADALGEVQYLGPSPSPENALAALAAPVCAWFHRRFGQPTPCQCLAWPALVAGKTLLLCAPTGSGKTLAAFLPIIDYLLADSASFRFCSSVRCLYIAPLKALGNDARKNLRAYLEDLAADACAGSPPLRVELRTGDSSAQARRRLRQDPPDILLTTPESLAVLLSQSWSAELFADLRWVIVDELHALAPNKRGADLSLSLERLEVLARPVGRPAELQRIGLSATCTPVAAPARFLAGAGRPCSVAQVVETGGLHLTVEPLPNLDDWQSPIERFVDRLAPELAAHRTTLIFTNVRSLAERLIWALRRRYPARADEMAIHHSSLSKGRRRDVERRLKQGELWAVVSSTSLELGIDIGTVDGVILIHPPGGVVRLLQRVGRAGHEPGRSRKGLVLTATPAEFLEAVVTAASGQTGQYEPLEVPTFPLDVLCQQLLGMACQSHWQPDEAFTLVRRAFPYRDLARRDFDACLDYLSGRRTDGQSWLPARLRWHGQGFTVAGQRNVRILRRNIGTIITEKPKTVRLRDLSTESHRQSAIGNRQSAMSLVGEVDEAFGDRLRPGDRFLLDGRCLEFCRSDSGALLVDEVVGRPVTPRWSGDGWPLSRVLAHRLYGLRVQAAEALREGPAVLAELLRRDYGLGSEAICALSSYFQHQECVSEIPDASTCLIEVVPADGGTYIHTPLNRAGNDALARAVAFRLARRRGWTMTTLVADLGLALFLPGGTELAPEEVRQLLALEAFDADLCEALAGSATLRERFRRVALTGLMVLRNPLGGPRRVGGPDWAARRLFDKVRESDPDFILYQQALREVREECCDAGAAREFLRRLPRLVLRRRLLPRVSPFAKSWTQATLGPVETVETPEEAIRRLHASLVGGQKAVGGGQ